MKSKNSTVISEVQEFIIWNSVRDVDDNVLEYSKQPSEVQMAMDWLEELTKQKQR